MNITSKILATVGVIFIFMLFSGLLQAGSGPGGRNPGIMGIILLFGVIAGIRAIWKSSGSSNNADNTSLRKD